MEKLFIMGNHDAVGYKYGPYVRTRYPDEAERRRRIIITDPKAAWERCFREPFAPIWEKTVCGYRFVGAHWLTGPNVEGLEDFLSARRNELLSDRPFFYIQHPPPAGTCYGSWAVGHDDGNSTRILSDDYFKGLSCLSRSVTCRVRGSSADACQVVPVGWTGLRGAAVWSFTIFQRPETTSFR